VETYRLTIGPNPLVVLDTVGRQVVKCHLEPDTVKQVLTDLGLSKD
jgi:hypothetical protein